MACLTARAVPGVRAICASQHILLYGTIMNGATLCPGNSGANTTSFAPYGLLGLEIAVMTASSKLFTSLGATFAAFTANNIAAHDHYCRYSGLSVKATWDRFGLPERCLPFCNALVQQRARASLPPGAHSHPRLLEFLLGWYSHPFKVASSLLGRLRAECAARKASDSEVFTSSPVSFGHLVVGANITSMDKSYTVACMYHLNIPPPMLWPVTLLSHRAHPPMPLWLQARPHLLRLPSPC